MAWKSGEDLLLASNKLSYFENLAGQVLKGVTESERPLEGRHHYHWASKELEGRHPQEQEISLGFGCAFLDLSVLRVL